MHTILVIGAGRIGTLTAALLKQAKYDVVLADAKPSSSAVISFDISNPSSVKAFFKNKKYQNIAAVISCLPYFYTVEAAKIAKEYGLHYFDLTEDVEASQAIKKLSKGVKTAFVPRCGLAPGLVGIVAHELASRFSEIDSIQLRVGGLPQYATNALHYAITWSVDGLINEYGKTCYALDHGKKVSLKPLEDKEDLEIDGSMYEAFNTSGGLGNLIELYSNKVNHLHYKTIRYPGHCEKIKFLMEDLKLNDDRETLKKILENALPSTTQDLVILAVFVTGMREGQLQEENFIRKYLPQKIGGKLYSALQLSTAASLCAVVHYVLQHSTKYHGFIFQEEISFEALKKDFFGKYL
ncbi:MAG: saccharopine dehydrogenase C-terminal domain-containing protein [Gammaproteobacteria bacterium]|nr:saccharopine dehydrogenase C-terminal domain-containing protein [Gammaproteobacteria bacterium]